MRKNTLGLAGLIVMGTVVRFVEFGHVAQFVPRPVLKELV